jgi:hypothetical protein
MMWSASECENNPIRAMLAAASMPWLMPRKQLVERYGVSRHPAYDHDVIEVATATPLFKNLLWPLSAQVSKRFSPHLPATYFSSATYFGEHSRENLQRTTKQLEPALGPAYIVERYNTVRCEWISGAASLRLTVWPLDLQDGRAHDNPSHKREPRLVTACHVDIDTGFRLRATDAERAWIKSFVPVSQIHFTSNAANEFDLEYVREPVAGLDTIAGHVGISGDGDALMFAQSQLYIVPMIDVLRFDVHRMTPAKGGGGSWLSVECRTQCESISHKSLHISQAPGADDLNELAATLAGLTKKPFTLGDYQPDC